MPAAIDLTNTRFGRLLALEPVLGRSATGYIVWRCLCTCGKEVFIPSHSLRSGNTRSCGCLKMELIISRGYRNRRDRVGKTFGFLLVLGDSGKRTKSGDVIWHCRCSCGKEIDVIGNNLGRWTISCGHLHAPIHNEMIRARNKIYTIRRKEAKRQLDNSWTKEMELELTKLQPSCVVCGSVERMTTDHVIPLSKGRGLQPGNAVRLCLLCNCKKKNKELSSLPADMQNKIRVACQQFEIYWKGLQCAESQ